MKKLAFFLVLALLLGVLSGCTGTPVIYMTNCTCPTATPVVEPETTEAPAATAAPVVEEAPVVEDAPVEEAFEELSEEAAPVEELSEAEASWEEFSEESTEELWNDSEEPKKE